MAIKGQVPDSVCVAPSPGLSSQCWLASHSTIHTDFVKSFSVKGIVLIDTSNQKRNENIFLLSLANLLLHFQILELEFILKQKN